MLEKEIDRIYKTTILHKETKHLTRKDVAKVYEHIFINKYELNGKVTNFIPDFYMAVSWERLSQGIPKYHDLIMVLHERLEYEYMNVCKNDYITAHNKANLKYNYAILVKELIKRGES